MDRLSRALSGSAGRVLLRAAILISWLVSGGCSAGEPPGAARNRDAIQSVILRDVHPLQGGQNIYLRGDGRGVVQAVSWDREAKSFHEKRYRLALAPAAMLRLEQVITDNAFFEVSIAERSGVPGEARHSLSVALASGRSASVSKWMRDRHRGFDAVYRALTGEARSAASGTPFHEGKLDPRWVPEGFGPR